MSQKQQEHLEKQISSEEDAREEGQVESVAPVESMPASTLPSTPMAEGGAITDAQQTSTYGDSQSGADAPQKKQRKKKGRWVSVEEISPKPSIWPLALTLSICVLLMGIMIHPIVIGVGAVLVIASIMGWILERR